jgi:hypothetical protein
MIPKGATSATISLEWQKEGTKKGEPIAAFVLSNNALDVVEKEELHVSTRSKIAAKPKESVKGT